MGKLHRLALVPCRLAREFLFPGVDDSSSEVSVYLGASHALDRKTVEMRISAMATEPLAAGRNRHEKKKRGQTSSVKSATGGLVHLPRASSTYCSRPTPNSSSCTSSTTGTVPGAMIAVAVTVGLARSCLAFGPSILVQARASPCCPI